MWAHVPESAAAPQHPSPSRSPGHRPECRATGPSPRYRRRPSQRVPAVRLQLVLLPLARRRPIRRKPPARRRSQISRGRTLSVSCRRAGGHSPPARCPNPSSRPPARYRSPRPNSHLPRKHLPARSFPPIRRRPVPTPVHRLPRAPQTHCRLRQRHPLAPRTRSGSPLSRPHLPLPRPRPRCHPSRLPTTAGGPRWGRCSPRGRVRQPNRPRCLDRAPGGSGRSPRRLPATAAFRCPWHPASR